MLAGRAHCKTMHGVWTGDLKTLAEVIECHDACHDRPIGHDIPHTHTRYDESDEWVW